MSKLRNSTEHHRKNTYKTPIKTEGINILKKGNKRLKTPLNENNKYSKPTLQHLQITYKSLTKRGGIKSKKTNWSGSREREALLEQFEKGNRRMLKEFKKLKV